MLLLAECCGEACRCAGSANGLVFVALLALTVTTIFTILRRPQ